MKDARAMRRFGENLKRLRGEAGLTQEALAKKIGSYQANVAEYESGEVDPRFSVVRRIAKILKVSLDELDGDRVPEIAAG